MARWLERQHHAFVQRSQRSQRRRPQDSANSCADPCDALPCHGLCDAERPDKAPLGLMLEINVRGNRPESNKPGDHQLTTPHHLQPVCMVSLRYPLWEATAASRNTTMVLLTQQTSTQPRAFDELNDTVHRFDTRSHEKPQWTARCPSASSAIKCVPTAEPAERGGCQVYRQAAPVPGSPPVTEFRSDVPISKGGLLLPFGAFPSASCWRDDGMTIQIQKQMHC